MQLADLKLDPRYATILDACEPFVITYERNLSALDLAPYGIEVKPEYRFDATRLSSRDVVDGLHHLDAATFGDQDMLMPRWVLFDCGEFPGLVFGFGVRAQTLPEYARKLYHVLDRNDAFVPLSMWVAIRCAEDAAWFGHNLSSANIILRPEDRRPGMATLTKILGVKATRSTKQYGATQWDSKSIGLHLLLGDMQLLSAYTPAHTHEETLSYLIDVDDAVLTRSLVAGFKRSNVEGERTLTSDDAAGIRSLQQDIESGTRLKMVRAERIGAATAGDTAKQRLHFMPV